MARRFEQAVLVGELRPDPQLEGALPEGLCLGQPVELEEAVVDGHQGAVLGPLERHGLGGGLERQAEALLALPQGGLGAAVLGATRLELFREPVERRRQGSHLVP